MNRDAKLEHLIGTARSGFSLPQAFYADHDVFEADIKRVYHRNWLLAGHGAQIRNPGDYFLFTIGTDSLIITRDDTHQVQALFNTCRHRGSTLCSEASGHVDRFVCPYHQWSYDCDGKLLNNRMMGPDFRKSQYSLHKAHVRVVEGLIYVCFAETPPDFDEAGDVLAKFLKPHGLERSKVCYSQEYEVKANWKLIFENNRECYHCAVGHREFCRTNYDMGMPGDPRRTEEYERVVEETRDYWLSNGLEVGPVNFPNDSWYRCARMPLKEGIITESMDGQPVAPIMGDLKIRDAGSLRTITLPNAWCHANSDNANLTQLMPIGPQLTRARITWLVHEDAVEGKDYDPQRVAELWKITTEQDWTLCEDNQIGINSTRYEPGPLSTITESGVEYFDQWYLAQLGKGAQTHPVKYHHLAPHIMGRV